MVNEVVPAAPSSGKSSGWFKMLGLAVCAAVAFTLAYAFSWGGYFMLGFLGCLFALAKFGTTRQVFYLGLLTGIMIYSVNLFFFYTIFQAAAVVLWLILSLTLTFFLLTARLCFARFKPLVAAALVPFVWTGFEYFRSELYYLRFTWANIGFSFSDWPVLPFQWIGVYGAGFLLAVFAIILLTVQRKGWAMAAGGVVLLASLLTLLVPSGREGGSNAEAASSGVISRVHVAAVQVEAPMEHQVLLLLNQLKAKFPETELFVLSEYTFSGPVPDKVRAWCREQERHLIVGGQEPAEGGDYYNTAFVVDPRGEVVFKQVKSVPVQFFKDGLPAAEQKVWASPWGKIGICLCYDFSYSRVTDGLVRLGAQALIVPTGDFAEWGKQQHDLHSRIAPVRAAEYGIPVFRVSSSGVSQLVDRSGNVLATAPFPGQLDMISGVLEFREPGRFPLDRLLAPFSVVVTGGVIGWLLVSSLIQRPRVRATEKVEEMVKASAEG